MTDCYCSTTDSREDDVGIQIQTLLENKELETHQHLPHQYLHLLLVGVIYRLVASVFHQWPLGWSKCIAFVFLCLFICYCDFWTNLTCLWFRHSGFLYPARKKKGVLLPPTSLKMDVLLNLTLSWLKAKTASFYFRALGLPFNLNVMKAAFEVKFLITEKKSIKIG